MDSSFSRSACLPECLPSTMVFCGMPTSVEFMISYVLALAMTPCWWMPDSCAKAFAPTMALLGGMGTPVMLLSSLLER